jgi:SAM-dependent methyltransferase
MQPMNNMVGPIARVSTCKVCQGEAQLYGVTDFNKNCEEPRGCYLPLAGVPIYYHRCGRCGLVFTNAFDHWTKSDYLQHIYNEDYGVVDPDYVEVRPAHNASLVFNFIQKEPALKCLDYGGGNGKLTALLRARGVDAYSWDPMAEEAEVPAPGSFDFVSAFEVLEHTPEPLTTVQHVLGLLNRRGVALFSTLTIDALPPRAIDHWYIAPRNGHITIHTRQSLQTTFAKFGYRVHHFNDNLHLASNID